MEPNMALSSASPADAKPPRRNAVAERKPEARSRVSNGATLFLDGDLRTKASRRFQDLLANIVSDLGGPNAGLSQGQVQIARRCALLSVQCEQMEQAAVAGDTFDVEAYGQLTDRLGRAFQRLGLKRVARNVTPNPLLDHFIRPPAR
jgi:hypothetical protein